MDINSGWLPVDDSNMQCDMLNPMQSEQYNNQSADGFAFLSRSASMTGGNGMPTPTLSPPQFGYLSPLMLERKPDQAFSFSNNSSSRLLSPPLGPPPCRTPEPQQSEDEEVLCIKLLSHLKKSEGQEHISLDEILSLVRKSTAAVRRILKSKKARSDYGCIMLLSNIMMKIVALCERAGKKHVEEPETSGDSPHFLTPFTGGQIYHEPTDHEFFNNMDMQPQPQPKADRRETVHSALRHAADLSSEVGDLLKRKPLNGFQCVGRHEALHLGLGHRLRGSMFLLQ